MNRKHENQAGHRPPQEALEPDVREFEQILKRATMPELPVGAEQRLQQRLSAMPGPVRRFGAVDKPADWSLPWLAGVPLAASLALGLYLGSAGSLDSWLPSSFTTADATTTWSDDPADLGGLSDAEADAGGSLS